ncbi:MAG: CsbD family protein [Candidatus Sulfotelmatobacter sp.]
MDKDRVEGKVKDVAGRVERQVGEWTGDTEKQAHGAAKQVEGKVQNAWGKVKDAAKSTNENRDPNATDNADEAEERKLRSERKAG